MVIRVRVRAGNALKAPVGRLMLHVLTPVRMRQLERLPSLPSWFRRRYAAVLRPWPSFTRAVPLDLQGAAGIRRDSGAEQGAVIDNPLM